MSGDSASGGHKRFVSEPVTPVEGTFDTVSMAAGEPGLPARFFWRGLEYEVVRVPEKWKSAGDCRYGSGEQYVRKHWFRVEATDGTVMELYFERNPRPGRSKQRWWLATIVENETTQPNRRGSNGSQTERQR